MTMPMPTPDHELEAQRPAHQDHRKAEPASPGARGRVAALSVAGFLAAFLPLNTYWALGGTWGVAWVLGCAGCTVPLSLVWVQEAMLAAGVGVVLARVGLWRPPLPSWIWRAGLWTMAVCFGAVGAQNLLGDTTPQARFLFAPLGLALGAITAAAARALAKGESAGWVTGRAGPGR